MIVVDRDAERVQRISQSVAQAVQADCTDENALRSLGLENVDAAVVSIGEQMEASILVTMSLKEMGIKTVIAKAMTEIQGKVLSRVGADRIVYPERDMGIKVANSLVSPLLLDRTELFPGYSLIGVEAPKSLWGKSLIESKIRSRYSIDVVAIKRSHPELDETGESTLKEEIEVAPAGETVINEGDVLMVIGAKENIAKLESKK